MNRGRVGGILGVGTWQPAILTSSDIVKAKILLAVFALIRAVDYGMDAYVTSGDAIEQSMPVMVWVGLCVAVGFLILIGMAGRMHWAVYCGHFLGAVTYLALAVGAAQHAALVFPPDDFRRVGPLLVMAFLHWTLAMRSGPTPLTVCKKKATVERVVAPRS